MKMTEDSDDGLVLNVTSFPTKKRKHVKKKKEFNSFEPNLKKVKENGFEPNQKKVTGSSFEPNQKKVTGSSFEPNLKKVTESTYEPNLKKVKESFEPNLKKVKESSFKPFLKKAKEKKDGNEKKYFGEGNDQRSKGHYSSLFANNPEIPKIGRKFVKPVTESVFSKMPFKDLGIHPYLLSNLEQNFNITVTTTVQNLSIPVLTKGKDALIKSQTGSGKTLAYAIPIIEFLQNVRPKITRSDGVKALIVLPTRELALQTYECFVKLVKSFAWLVPGLLVGGEKKKSEKARLRKGVTILIGTPGRLVDHVQHTRVLRLDAVRWLILDEADRLLDEEYERDVSSLVNALEDQRIESEDRSLQRQTVLLSATLTPKVERLAGLTLKDPARIDASSKEKDEMPENQLTIPKALKQFYVVTPPKLRLVTLSAVIHWRCCQEKDSRKMLVFMATQDMVDYHIELLSTVLTDSADYFKLHGNMTQDERTQIFKTFRAASSGVLFCTDVASRGLDLPKVDWIVQYTAPTTPADYVHRVGRTARVSQSGSALLFLTPTEVPFIRHLEEKQIRLEEEKMENCLNRLRLMDLEGAEEFQRSRIGGPTVEAAATALQLQFENAVIDQTKLHESASKGYRSWVRFYASYPKESMEAFNFKNLHLGHYAKSFALRDAPSVIGGIGKPKYIKEKNNKQKRWDDKPNRRQSFKQKAVISEFDSGIDFKKKKKKKDI